MLVAPGRQGFLYSFGDNPNIGNPFPDQALMEFRPSALLGTYNDGDSVASFPDAGSYGWNMIPTTAVQPTFNTDIDNLSCIQYGYDGANNTSLVTTAHTPVELPIATVLVIFRPISWAVTTSYLTACAVAGRRFDVARIAAGDGMFIYRSGTVTASTEHPTPGAWNYLVGYYNNTDSIMNVNGVLNSVSPGTNTQVSQYQIGAYGTSATYRFYGYIADVGVWSGDRQADAELYCRTKLGLL